MDRSEINIIGAMRTCYIGTPGSAVLNLDALNSDKRFLEIVKSLGKVFIQSLKISVFRRYKILGVEITKLLEPIELKAKAVTSERKIVLMSKFSPVEYAAQIKQFSKFILDKNKVFWRYDPQEGIWNNDAEQFIKSYLGNNLMGDEQQK